MMKLYCWFASKMKSEEGAALAEYGLLVGLIAAVCGVAVGLLGDKVNAIFTSITGAI